MSNNVSFHNRVVSISFLAAGSQPILVGVAMESFLAVRTGRRLRCLFVFIDRVAPPILPCLEVYLHSNPSVSRPGLHRCAHPLSPDLVSIPMEPTVVSIPNSLPEPYVLNSKLFFKRSFQTNKKCMF